MNMIILPKISTLTVDDNTSHLTRDWLLQLLNTNMYCFCIYCPSKCKIMLFVHRFEQNWPTVNKVVKLSSTLNINSSKMTHTHSY